jgi:hypothetical protein
MPTDHPCAAAFPTSLAQGALKDSAMKTLAIVTAVAGTLISVPAQAQERVGSAILGGIAGFFIAGPIGAGLGAGVGYSAGPEMGRGLTQPGPRPKARRAARPALVTKGQAAAPGTPPPVSKGRPPVAQATPPVAKAPAAIASTKAAPPVQTFE